VIAERDKAKTLRVGVVRVVTITEQQGQQHRFIPTNSSAQALAPVAAIIERMRRFQTRNAQAEQQAVQVN
jgi:hypothetical protein